MGNWFDDYEDYRLYQEIYGEEKNDSGEGDGCLVVVLGAFGLMMLLSIF